MQQLPLELTVGRVNFKGRDPRDCGDKQNFAMNIST